jgi:hypothetical protein
VSALDDWVPNSDQGCRRSLVFKVSDSVNLVSIGLGDTFTGGHIARKWVSCALSWEARWARRVSRQTLVSSRHEPSHWLFLLLVNVSKKWSSNKHEVLSIQRQCWKGDATRKKPPTPRGPSGQPRGPKDGVQSVLQVHVLFQVVLPRRILLILRAEISRSVTGIVWNKRIDLHIGRNPNRVTT